LKPEALLILPKVRDMRLEWKRRLNPGNFSLGAHRHLTLEFRNITTDINPPTLTNWGIRERATVSIKYLTSASNLNVSPPDGRIRLRRSGRSTCTIRY